MSYGTKILVSGDYACFTRPELKVERVTYPIMTPSAAIGILEAIYWKPAIIWHIDKIHVLNPIQYINIKRNEVKDVATVNKQFIDIRESRTQKTSTILKDVKYIIDAHFEPNPKFWGERDTIEKHYAIMQRRLSNGQFYNAPFLGNREFFANIQLIEQDIKSELKGIMDCGFILHSIDYADPKNVKPTFCHAILQDGVLDLTQMEGKYDYKNTM